MLFVVLPTLSKIIWRDSQNILPLRNVFGPFVKMTFLSLALSKLYQFFNHLESKSVKTPFFRFIHKAKYRQQSCFKIRPSLALSGKSVNISATDLSGRSLFSRPFSVMRPNIPSVGNTGYSNRTSK